MKVVQMVDKRFLIPNVSGLGKGTNWQDKVLMACLLSIMICRFRWSDKATAGSLWTKKVLLAVTSRGFKEYGTSIFRS
jgi:hypothetical protein